MPARLHSSWIPWLSLPTLVSLFYLYQLTRSPEDGNSDAMALVAVEYEVWGRVQGVFFRKFTHQKAQSLGLRGWVKNTR